MPQTENIGDLLLQQLNDPQKMQQLGQMLSSLGLAGRPTRRQMPSRHPLNPTSPPCSRPYSSRWRTGTSDQNQPSRPLREPIFPPCSRLYSSRWKTGARAILLLISPPCSWPCSRARRRMVQTLQGRLHQELISPPCCPRCRVPHPGPTRRHQHGHHLKNSADDAGPLPLQPEHRPAAGDAAAALPAAGQKGGRRHPHHALIQLLPALKESGLFALGGDSQ